jgi:hypothetical protein
MGRWGDGETGRRGDTGTDTREESNVTFFKQENPRLSKSSGSDPHVTKLCARLISNL